MFEKIHPTWKRWLAEEFCKPYFVSLVNTINSETDSNVIIYPAVEHRLAVLHEDPLKIKCVILGQDPYFNEGQAHGYSFSVPVGVKVPSSLRNIYKEVKNDINSVEINTNNGNLQRWVNQGVFLLNAVLTVKQGLPNSHAKLGWGLLTTKVIELLSLHVPNVVYMLWGANAQKKAVLIDGTKNLILQTSHPSGLSAYRGFIGCKHFSQANNYLKENRSTQINWSNQSYSN